MADLPTGTVTFLFTDIEGSTKLARQFPDVWPALQARHHSLLQDAITNHRGYVFKTAGDEVDAAFETALDALAAALDAQSLLDKEDWGAAGPVRVRMGVHTGPARLSGGDYDGYLTLSHAKRLMSIAYGGQILISQPTGALLPDPLPHGASLRDLGEQRLKDFERPEHIFQLVAPGLPAGFPPLKTLDATPNNLPVQLTSFVGRGKELAEVRRLLATTRLLTLIGPGGTGKTRLALQAANDALEDFPDGAWLAELASLANPELVLQNIASIFSLREKPGLSLMESLSDYLCSRRLLLLLDNCEHLIETCATIADHLLHACPDLKILVSSRENLGIAGEVSYRVPPLSLPQTQADHEFDDLRQNEAVELFTERAQSANTRFTLNRQNAAAVVQICRRLDGIPLAIELTAARVKIFSPEQIASRLDDRFRLLTGGSRTALPRQQTLQALIDWSYEMLSEAEKTLFRRLSVFSGGWSFEAAETACSGGTAGGAIEPYQVLDLLSQLVNKSLVLVEEQGEQARYRFLETVRQYASEKLVTSGEAAQVRDRHLAYYVDQARQSGSERYVFDLEHPSRITWVDSELDNLRLALEWALANNIQAALEIAGNFSVYWGQLNYYIESLRNIRQVRLQAETLPEFQGEMETENQKLLALSWLAEGGLLTGMGENKAAALALDRCLQLSRPIQADEMVANARSIQSVNYSLSDNLEAARQASVECIALARKLGNRPLLAMTTVSQARIVNSLQGYQPAREMLVQAMAEFDRDENHIGSALARMALGNMGIGAADYDEAERYLQDSYQLFAKYGDRHFMIVSRSGLAEIARLRGDFLSASRLYHELIESWVKIGNRGAVARCMECLAFIHINDAQKQPEEMGTDQLLRAANLFGAAEALRAISNSPMTREEQREYDEQLAGFKRLLKPEELEPAWAAGSRLGLNQAVELALGSGSLDH